MAKQPKWRRAKIILKSLKGGAGIYAACQGAGINHTTFYRWRQEKPSFDALVQRILDSRTQLVIDAMYQAALKGNITAQIFWLKNKAGWKDSPYISISAIAGAGKSALIIEKTYDNTITQTPNPRI